MMLEKYLAFRLKRVTPENFRTLSMEKPEVMMFWRALWTKQLYEHLLEKRGNK